MKTIRIPWLVVTLSVTALFALSVSITQTQALIKITHYAQCPNVQYQYTCVGPLEQGALNMVPYLDSTSPSGKQVCVGHIHSSAPNTLHCIVVTGFGQGLGASSGDAKPGWQNVDPSQTTTTYNVHWTAYYD